MDNTRNENGSALVTVAMLMLVAGILGVALVAFMVQQNKFRTASEADRSLQQALDLGYDKAIGALNSGSNWTSGPTLAGFTSVTAAAQTDLGGLKYWVMILPGARSITATGGTLDDTTIQAWPQGGDPGYDRTIVVRAVQTATLREAWAVAVVHRNNTAPYNPIQGIYSTGSVNTAGWGGQSYNSCVGARIAATQTPGCTGSVSGGGAVQASGMCLPTQVVTTTPMPTYVIPTPVTTPSTAWGPWPMPGNGSIGQDWAAPNGTTTLGPGPKAYECANLSGSGNRSINIDPSGGPVVVYVTGSISWAGSGNITSDGPVPGGSPPNAIIICNGPSVSLKGTGTYEIQLLAPQAAVTLNGGGNGSFSGAIVSASMNVTGGGSGTFYFDTCLLKKTASDNYQNPPVVTLLWRRFR